MASEADPKLKVERAKRKLRELGEQPSVISSAISFGSSAALMVTAAAVGLLAVRYPKFRRTLFKAGTVLLLRK